MPQIFPMLPMPHVFDEASNHSKPNHKEHGNGDVMPLVPLILGLR